MAEPIGDPKRPYPENCAEGELLGRAVGEGGVPGQASESATAWPNVAVESPAKRQKNDAVADPMAKYLKPAAVAATKAVAPAAGFTQSLQRTDAVLGPNYLGVQPAYTANSEGSTPAGSATSSLATTESFVPRPQSQIGSNPIDASEKSSYAQSLSVPPKTTSQSPQNPDAPPLRKESPPPPLKSSTYHHLHKKYSPELDYMLVEFRKLERQLLGAPPIQQLNKSNNINGKQAPKKVENAGSRERREKLQGFISHLEDTIRQISEGILCEKKELLLASDGGDANSDDIANLTQPQHQEEKKSSDTFIKDQPITGSAPSRKFTAEQASLSQLPPEKEKEESVQRLEEHILANLLPVKARLTRQLAAQKGATKNPVTAPLSARHGHLRNSETGGTIKEEAEAKRKAMLLQQQQQQHFWKARAGPATGAVSASNPAGPTTSPSQYGKPLGQAGSSLTARLHGAVLGASKTVDSPCNAPMSVPGAAVGAASAKSPSPATPATNEATNVTSSKRRILYAGIAPGSTQVPSSVNAAAGVHPGFVGEEAAKAVAMAEEEKKRLQNLEASAVRVALGGGPSSTVTVAAGSLKPVAPIADSHKQPAAIPTPVHSTIPATVKSSSLPPTAQRAVPTQATSVLKSQCEGPATLAARARAQQAATALAAARASNSVMTKSQPNQPIPPITKIPTTSVHSGAQYIMAKPPQYQPKTPAMTSANVPPAPNIGHQIHAQARVKDSAKLYPFTSTDIATLPVKKKKPYTTPDFNDPSLTPAQQFDLRLKEARRRQRKRRRARRRQRRSMELDHSVLMQKHSPHGQAYQHQQRILNDSTGARGSSIAAGRQGENAGSPGGSVIAATALMASNGSFGTRSVEYVCAICNEAYPSSCDINPWWALSSQECPKCGKNQIPRLDISAPANTIEYHPALLAHLDENSGSIVSDNTAGVNSSPSKSQQQSMQGSYLARQTQIMNGQCANSIGSSNLIRKSATFSDSEVSVTDESDGEGGSGDYNFESSDEDDTLDDNLDGNSMAMEERVEREDFGFDYKGDKLTVEQARKLLVLIEHASTCPGRHRSAMHRNVCHSTKYLMLHVRDCPGLLSNGDICPFPWCRKVKHLLYHLVSCQKNSSKVCTICCSQNISPNFDRLVGLNHNRRKIYMERSIAFAAAAAHRQMAASNTAKIALAHRSPAAASGTRIPQYSYQRKHPQDIVPTTYRAPVQQSKVAPTPQPPPSSIPAYTSVPIPSTLAAAVPSQTATAPHTKTYPSATYAPPVHTAPTNYVAQAQQKTETVSTQRTVYATNPLCSNPDASCGTDTTLQRNDSSALEPLPSPSPAFAALPSSMSALSVFNLEDPEVDIGDVDLSSSDLISHLEPADLNTVCDANQTNSSADEIKGSLNNDGPATQALSSRGTTL